MLEAPILLERDHISLTIAWKSVGDAHTVYEVSMSSSSDDFATWTVLSSTIKNHNVKKKNLTAGLGYQFKIRAKPVNNDWSAYSHVSEPFYVLPETFHIMDAPTFLTNDGNSITIQWLEVLGADGYRLRYRKESETTWSFIESEIKGTKAKKKGLLPTATYYFAVLPVFNAEQTNNDTQPNWSFSLSSAPVKTATLHPTLANLLPMKLLTKQPDTMVDCASLLSGKIIGLYFSAHWCGPCRNFTPRLAELYAHLKQLNKPFEIIFCSADHSEKEFTEYYATMPWLAIDYDESKREQIMGQFQVSGIPKLTILGANGQKIEDNAVGKPLTPELVDQWIKQGLAR